MKKNILLIDDDPDILDAMSLALESEGYAVEKVAHSKDIQNALIHLNYHPNIIVIDTFLSDTDGRKITHVLKNKKKTAKIPIILMSAVSDIKYSAKQSGANAFIEKPFNLQDLIKTIHKHILE